MLLEPQRTRQLTILDDKLTTILEHIVPTPPLQQEHVPDFAASRFHESLERELRRRSATLETLNRGVALDAVYKHWHDSASHGTEDFSQYLSLLKVAWLIMQLESASPFTRARRGSPYRTCIIEVRRRIAGRVTSDELAQRYENPLGRLDPNSFSILDDASSESQSAQLEEYVLEDRLCSFDVPPEPGFDRTILQVNRISPTQLRLIWEKNDNAVDPVMRSSDFGININTDFLVPWYAAPNAPQSALSLGFGSGNGTGGKATILRTLEDILFLQQAFTGYAVDYDKIQVTTIINEKHSFLRPPRNMESQSRLQLWRWSPLQPKTMQSSTQNSGGIELRPHSDMSTSVTSTLSNVMDGIESTLSDGNRASTIHNNRSGQQVIVSATAPVNPVLMLFTAERDAFVFLHLESKSRACALISLAMLISS